jgi:hypothetical protein
MRDVSILLLVVFTVIASYDGFWFHLWKLRLHTRPQSRLEHQLHTWNAIAFPVTLVPLYLADVAGLWLWLGVLLHVAVFAVESVDVAIEKDSRADLGGLSKAEACLHFAMSGLRWGYVALALGALPTEAWTAPTRFSFRAPDLADPIGLVPWAVAIAGLPIALLHVALGRPRFLGAPLPPIRRPESA